MIRRPGWARLVGAGAMVFAAPVLAGWWWGAWSFTSVGLVWAPVRPNSAFGLLLAGCAVATIGDPRSSGGWKRGVGTVCAVAVMILGAATVAEYVGHVDLGIDRLFVPTHLVPDGGALVMRMSEATAWSFALLGAALACLERDVAIGAAQGMLAVVVAVQLLGGLGYAYDGPSAGATGPFVTVGLHSAVLLFVLSVTALWTRPERGIMRAVAGPGPGARTMRRMLPLLVVVLFGAGLLRVWGARLGIYSPEREEPIIVVVVFIVLTAALWYNAELLSRAEADRDRFFMLGGDMFCIIDVGGNFARVNLAASRALGWSADELKGRPLTDFVHDDDRAAVERELIALRPGRAVEGFEARVRTRDGRWRLVSWTASAGSRRRFVYVTGRDVTDLRAAQESLRESEENLAITVHSIGDGVIATDAAGLVTRVNPAAERLTGWSADEARGRPVSEVFRVILEATRTPAPVPVEAVLRTGAQAGISNHTILVARDGTERPLGDSAAPIRNGSGALVGVVMVFRDISAERAAERSLQESKEELERRVAERTAALAASERQFSDLFEFAPDGVVIVDADGRITLANRAAEHLFGWARADMLGRPVEMLVPLASREPHEAWRAGYGQPGGARSVRQGPARLAAMRRDGSEFPVEISLSPMHSGGDHLVVASVRDVTDRVELEAQFLQAQKMESIGVLAGAVAHDFNNLLTVINSMAEMAAAGLREDDPIHRDLLTIRDAGWRAADLTRQLLAFSRRQVLQPRVLNPNTVVEDMMPIVGRLLGESIVVRLKLATDMGNTRVDRAQLEQVLMNLVVNARDAMPAGGTVTVETQNAELDETYVANHAGVVPGEFVLLSVTDTGVGMDAATTRRIFEPFFTTKGAGRGTGLGLSTVYGIVKQSGGDVWVYSEVGVGTTFKVYLPRVRAPEALGAVVKTPPAATGTETILVVEDEASLRTLSHRILGSAGYTVLTASDGADALAQMERHDGPIHLVLTDLMMPGLSGRELGERVRALHPGVKVMFTSGYAEEVGLQEGVPEGSRFIAKPFSAEQLRAAVREALDSAG